MSSLGFLQRMRLIAWFVPRVAASVELWTKARRSLLVTDVKGGKRVVRVEVEQITLAPRQRTGVHVHHCPTVGNVTRGAIHFQLEGQAARLLRVGDAFCVPANVRTLHFDNACQGPATVVVCHLLGAGERAVSTMLSCGED